MSQQQSSPEVDLLGLPGTTGRAAQGTTEGADAAAVNDGVNAAVAADAEIRGGGGRGANMAVTPDDDDEEDDEDEDDEEEENEDASRRRDIEMSEFEHEFFGYKDDPDAAVAASRRGGVHDQLPSVEEIKAASPSTSATRRFKWNTCCLSATLLALVVVAIYGLVSFFQEDDAPPAETKFDPSGFKDYDGLPPTTPAKDQNNTAAITEDMSVVEIKLRRSIALQGGAEFDDPDSYQRHVLNYMIDRPDLYSGFLETDFLKQTYALLCLYFATNGPTAWTMKEKWLHKDTDCYRPGVDCNGGLWVEKLNMPLYGMTGEIPIEITLLHHLREITLDNNPGLTGKVPDFLGTMALKTLSIENCGFKGTLPQGICDYAKNDPFFILELDCKKILCQPICCEACYHN